MDNKSLVESKYNFGGVIHYIGIGSQSCKSRVVRSSSQKFGTTISEWYNGTNGHFLDNSIPDIGNKSIGVAFYYGHIDPYDSIESTHVYVLSIADFEESLTATEPILEVNDELVLSDTLSQTMCLNDTAKIKIENYQNYAWEWRINGVLHPELSHDFIQNITETTTVEIIGERLDGCIGIKEFSITFNPTIVINTIHDTICAGDYYYESTNLYNCDSLVHLSVAYTPQPMYVDSFIRACVEVEYGGRIYTESVQFIDIIRTGLHCDSLYRNVRIEVLQNIFDTVQVAICEGETYSFNNKSLSYAGIYTDTFLHDNGCDSFITLILTVNPLPDVGLEYTYETIDDLLCIGDTVLLKGTGATKYEYLNNYQDQLTNQDYPLVRLHHPSNTYYVIGWDDNGCWWQTDVTIYAEACCDIMMPNAFSPNGDGLNDAFGPITTGHPDKYRLEIFNRYGESIFISNKVEDRWTGTKNNKENVDVGIYYYVITGQCYDGTPIQIKGDVTLVR